MTFKVKISAIFLVPQLALAQPLFTDVTTEAGINHYFNVFDGTFGGGAVVLDFNLDGYEDVFLAGGMSNNMLYKNKGDGTFEDVSINAGMELLNGKVTQGGVSADVNKDGYPDLFITTISLVEGDLFNETSNILLTNNKDGTFSDQTIVYGLEKPTFSTGASFGDVNKDGFPDLYVSNYFKDFEGRLDQYSGTILNDTNGPAADLLYINQSGSRFIESAEEYGMNHVGLGFQGVWSDIDNDHDLDLLIANDFGNRGHPNYIYQNDYPERKFTEIGAAKGFDYGINAMGIGVCDYNMDGWMDYLVTNIQKSPFFINQGKNTAFADNSNQLGTAFSIVYTNEGSGVAPVSWGVNFFDADLDMDEDLYITNGCLNPALTPNPNLFLENDNGTFLESGYISNTNDQSIGRGSVVFDYDNDGDLDILVVNQVPHQDQDIGVDFLGTRLFRNDNSQNNYLKIKLKGKFSETSGIGSRVEVYVDGNKLIREIDGGSSHESQNSTIAHFGLSTFSAVDSVIIYWSRLGRQIHYNVEANQTLEVTENIILGSGTEKDLVDKLFVYPIPVQDKVHVKLPDQAGKIEQVEIISMGGNIISDVSIIYDGSPNQITLVFGQELRNGLYMLRITTTQKTFFRKIIK